jgi:hypothetical protein
MNTEIQRADIGLRRVTLIVLILATLAAAGLVLLARNWMIAKAIASTPQELVVQMRFWISIASMSCGLCLLLLAAYTWRLARRASTQRRWPLAEARVLRDTPIRHGDAALATARLLNMVSLLLFVFSAATIVLSWRLFAVVR